MGRRFVVSAIVILAAAAAGVAAPLSGIPMTRLFPGTTFDPAIPAPSQALGVEPGSRPLDHEEIVRYFRLLAKVSPRATLIPYASSFEGRPLFVLAVGDAHTIADLEAFRKAHDRLVDPRTGAATSAALRTAKAVAWMAYGIHGDELSSPDAAVAVAYWLAAGENGAAAAIRSAALVLIDPCENPDGRERFLAQVRSFAHAEPNPDTQDLSHTTVWPWGRGNHYLFDLNRDWFTMIQPESRRSPLIASWNPQLMVDAHEMGANDTYLFSPARHPFNPFRPAYLKSWAATFAADQARALDARGYGYYTREWNEEFFPGYGSSWASYLGAIGILYEMAGTQGTLVRQRAGTVRTFAQAVEHQVTSSVANLRMLAAHREAILEDFVAARRREIDRGRKAAVRAWILPPGRYPARTDRLAGLLAEQGIEVKRLAAPVEAPGLHDARDGTVAARRLPAGTWMVRMDQPAAPLAHVLLDPHIPMSMDFLREEREYLEKGRGSRLYETTAWSLPLAFGIEAYWTGTPPAGEWKAGRPVPPGGALKGGGEVFGYLVDGTSDRAAFALGELLADGIKVRVADRAFRVGGRDFPPSTILIEREGNPGGLASRLEKLARRWGIEVVATPTAKAETGPDLGGHHFHPLVAPRVAVVTGMPVAPSSYGAVWYLLDGEMRLRFTAIDVGRLRRTDLERFNVIVFPPAFTSPGGYRAAVGKDGFERLVRWVKAGGTVIGMGSGAELLADTASGLTRTRLRRQALDRYPPVVLGPSAATVERAGLFRATGIRAPGKDKKAGAAAAAGSPYDVPPVIGPGARPFVPADERRGTAAPPVDLATWLAPWLPPGAKKPDKKDLERADERLRRFHPHGAFLRAEVDTEAWPAWGLPKELPVFVHVADALVARPPVRVVVRLATDPVRLHLSGLLWPEAAGRLAGTAYLTREAVGRGQVILFLDHPAFRDTTLATRRLLINAILYGPGVGTRWPSPW
jgi:Zinc carboxypeptidase.